LAFYKGHKAVGRALHGKIGAFMSMTMLSLYLTIGAAQASSGMMVRSDSAVTRPAVEGTSVPCAPFKEESYNFLSQARAQKTSGAIAAGPIGAGQKCNGAVRLQKQP